MVNQYLTQIIMASFYAGLSQTHTQPKDRAKYFTDDSTKMYQWSRKRGFVFDKNPEGGKS